MNTLSGILEEMIKQDMQQRGITRYHISDELAENPKQINVGANETVYVYYLCLKHQAPPELEITLLSASTKINYTKGNTRCYYRGNLTGLSGEYDYIESSRISRHLSSIAITQKGTIEGFYIQYIKVKNLNK